MIGVVPLLPHFPMCFQAMDRENFTFLLKFTYSVNYWLFLPEFFTRFLLPLRANRVTCIVSEKLCAFSELLKLQYVTCVSRRLGSSDR
jgi:hypothetical protein